MFKPWIKQIIFGLFLILAALTGCFMRRNFQISDCIQYDYLENADFNYIESHTYRINKIVDENYLVVYKAGYMIRETKIDIDMIDRSYHKVDCGKVGL